MPRIIILRPKTEINVPVGHCQAVPSKPVSVWQSTTNGLHSLLITQAQPRDLHPPGGGNLHSMLTIHTEMELMWSTYSAALRSGVSTPGLKPRRKRGAAMGHQAHYQETLLATVAGMVIMFNPDITWLTSAVPASVLAIQAPLPGGGESPSLVAQPLCAPKGPKRS